MISFRVFTAKGKRIFGFGLTKVNLALLEEGNPIFFDMQELGLPGVWTFIVYAKTENEGQNILDQHRLPIGAQVFGVQIDRLKMDLLRQYKVFCIDVSQVTGCPNDEVMVFGGETDQVMKQEFNQLIAKQFGSAFQQAIRDIV